MRCYITLLACGWLLLWPPLAALAGYIHNTMIRRLPFKVAKILGMPALANPLQSERKADSAASIRKPVDRLLVLTHPARHLRVMLDLRTLGNIERRSEIFF